MGRPINILLQTTIPAIADDWNIDRFSLLGQQRFKISVVEHENCPLSLDKQALGGWSK